MKKKESDKEIYDRIKDMLLDRITRSMPRVRSGLLTCAQDVPGSYWFLLSDTDKSELIFLKGQIVTVDGCIDGFNVYPTYSPLISMLTDLELVTVDEAAAYRRESGKVRDQIQKESDIQRVGQMADNLGYTLTKKK